MKKIYLYILSAVVALGTFTSCEDMFGDFLDKQPSNELTEEEVFSNWKNTQAFQYDLYNFLLDGKARINFTWMDSATDLGESSYARGTRTSFNIGNYFAASGSPELTATWNHHYQAIRKCNILIDRIDDVPLSAEETEETRKADRDRMVAECRFFRAYFYWELCLRYGPVPLILTELSPEDNTINNYPRPELVTCFSYIIRELDDCLADLDGKPDASEYGRITKAANRALMSRIKLYLASPRYSDLKLANWQDAMEAAEEFIRDWGEGSLGDDSKMTHTLLDDSEAINNYSQAITRRVFDGNKEVIFWRNDNAAGWWPEESPVGFGGYGGLTPSQNLVDMYDMADGTSPFAQYDETGAPVYNANGIPTVNPASGYSDEDPYENRDPRFYRTVLYHGAQWWGRPIDTSEGGADKPKGNAFATSTGYYNRKYLDDSQTHYLNGGVMYRNWIFIRYAEILLNYAEAMNELNAPPARVLEPLQKLRDRVGLTAPLVNRADLQDRENLRNFIRKERTIELAFEDHRSWDLRRWNVAQEALARPIYGISVKEENGKTTYERIVTRNRVFTEKMYLYPIPEEEIWKTGISNNPGW